MRSRLFSELSRCRLLLSLVYLVFFVMVYIGQEVSHPDAEGFYVRTRPAPAMVQQVRVVVAVRCSPQCDQPHAALTITVNGKYVSKDELRDQIRAELSRNIHAVVYLSGENYMNVGRIMQVIDTIQDAWYGVPIVMLTPQLEKSLPTVTSAAADPKVPH